MSRQRELLPAVVARLATMDPACSILVIGSIRYHYERPESDIDVIAIVHDGIQVDATEWQVSWENRGIKSLVGNVAGVHVGVFFASISGLERWLRETPYHMYPFSRGEILRDPEGLAERYQAVAKGYFEAHPRIAEEWETQLQSHKQVKLAGRDKDGLYRTADGQLRKYLTLDEFAARITNLARGEPDDGGI